MKQSGSRITSNGRIYFQFGVFPNIDFNSVFLLFLPATSYLQIGRL
jgi:hypothetical protein